MVSILIAINTNVKKEEIIMAKATLTGEVITKDDGTRVAGFTSQGFVMNSNTGRCFVARLNNNVNNEVILTKVEHFGNDKGKIVEFEGSKSNYLQLGHANDCAYYNGRIFIAEQNKKKEIASYTSEFNSKVNYPVYGNKNIDMSKFPQFTFISYMEGSGGWFVLGQGRECATAWFSGKKFTIVSQFTLPDVTGKIKRSDSGDIDGQGVCVDGWAFFRAFSHHLNTNSNVIKKNDIVSYVLTGEYPSYTGAVYMSHSSCDRTDLDFFEVESMSYYNRNFYISATTKNNSKTQNRIYKITF